ncbi:MAG: alpha-mannosidase, partial [Clostridia bacterium]|nr:alpha-mannosidase [Clostridia bacterium]
NDKLDTWDGELYLEMHRGTFTTKSDIKKQNRTLEFKLREAEMLCALDALNGAAYPSDELRDCWKKLLLNQFHDILPGSHIHPVYEDCMADYKETDEKLNKLFKGGEKYFNSLNFDRQGLTFIEDENGTVVRHGKSGFWAMPMLEGLSAGNVEALEGEKNWLQVENAGNGLKIETPFYCLRMNADGSFASLEDKELDREWVKPGCGFNKMHLYADHPGTYDAWDILPNYKDVEPGLPVVTSARLTKQDDVSAEFAVDFATEKSRWQMIIRLFSQSRAIEVEHVVDWHEKHRLAKVNFGPDVLTRELMCDTSAGFVRRSLTKNTTWEQARFEVCHHKWMDMSEGGAGVAIINEGKYGVGLEGDEISLSLLRATIRPDVTSDMGHHDFCYVILPHAGDAVQASVNQLAFEYNVPLVKADAAVPEMLRETLNNCGLYLQSMKLSEDGSQLIVRLSEQDGARGKLKLPVTAKLLNMLEDEEGEADVISYRPFEIITLGFPMDLLK